MTYRRVYRLLSIVLVLVMLTGLAASPTTAQTPTSDDSRVFLSHGGRFTALIPGDWRPDREAHYQYAGRDGYIAAQELFRFTSSLDAACDHLVTFPVAGGWRAWSATSFRNAPACRALTNDGHTTGVVITHPDPPITGFYRPTISGFVSVYADTAHMDDILASIDFTDTRLTPDLYLEAALDAIESQSYFITDVDWEQLRADAMEFGDGNLSFERARSGIEFVLATLQIAGDNHSSLTPVDQVEVMINASSKGFGIAAHGEHVAFVYPDSSAAHAGIAAGDRIVTINGEDYRSVPYLSTLDGLSTVGIDMTLERQGIDEPYSVKLPAEAYLRYLPPSGQRFGPSGYIQIPGFSGPFQRDAEFAQTGAEIVARLDTPETCGWIVDLRLNTGGSYFPMISAVAGLLGEGTLLGFAKRNGETGYVHLDDGALVDSAAGSPAPSLVSVDVMSLRDPDAPVAVLIGPNTASSGEATTLAFVNRPHTRLFGKPTAGFSTGVQTFSLYDGSLLGLATVVMTDRTGAPYPSGITTDVDVYQDYATFGSAEDPAIIAAEAWLAEQPACTAT